MIKGTYQLPENQDPEDWSPYGYILPEVTVTLESNPNNYVIPRLQGLLNSKHAQAPYVNFYDAQDLSPLQKIYAYQLSDISNPKTCALTATHFFGSPVASNEELISNPEKYNFKLISEGEAGPGDIIVLSDKNNNPGHAVLFDSRAKEDANYGSYQVNKGDILVNYSNGGRNTRPYQNYRLQRPLTVFDDPEKAGGDFSGKKYYLRYTGDYVPKQYKIGGRLIPRKRYLK